MNWPADEIVQTEIDDHEIDDADNVRRTTLQDGLVQQQRLNTRGLKVRRFNVAVPADRVAEFRQWVADHGSGFFNFRDPEDGVVRECRIQGGKIPLRCVRGERLANGSKFYRGLAVLESLS